MRSTISIELRERLISFLKDDKIGIQIESHSMDTGDLSNTLQLKLILSEESKKEDFIKFTELHKIVNRSIKDYFAFS